MAQPREIVRRTIRMPEAAGIELANAQLVLRNAGFEPEQVRIRYEEAYRPEDEVIRQVPSPGALVPHGEPVELVVSRRSLIHQLPQVYQKADRGGRHFLRDFLWIFDHLYAGVERQIDRLSLHFDPLEAPQEFLAWLASWVALAIDQDWPEPKKRRLIRQAMEMYGFRGTVVGLKIFLSIFTEAEPRILENRWPYDGFRVGKVRIGLDSIVLPPVKRSHSFVVELPAEFNEASDETILKVHDIIRMEKPSHSAYFLTFARQVAKDRLKAFTIGFGRVGLEEAGVVPGSNLDQAEASVVTASKRDTE